MKRIAIVFLAVFCVAVSLNAQVYKNVKVNMSNGLQVKGISASIENDTLSMQSRGVMRKISLSEVNSMMAKSGKADMFALGCGAGCLGFGVLDLVVGGGEAGLQASNITMSQYVASYLLFIGASAGVGYLIGSLLDPYEVVYIKESSFLDKVKLNITTDQFALKPISGDRIRPISMGTPMLSVSYRF